MAPPDLNPEIPGLSFSCRRYGTHNLQRVGVWQFESPEPRDDGHWIIFIHGGAWRAPVQTYKDFVPSIRHIVKSDRIPQNKIRGFASIDYRLSPNPGVPQNPGQTPESELQLAKHPDHVHDVMAALNHLKAELGISDDKYILIGHSAGATLSFQLLFEEPPTKELPPLPSAIITTAGIYDMVSLEKGHPGYHDFLEGAFGSSMEDWKRASPASFTGSYQRLWPGPRTVLLSWSPEDSLVDEEQVERMAQRLVSEKMRLIVRKDMTGDHDVVWEEGAQVHDLVATVLAQDL